MVQIIEENRKPSFAQRLSKGVETGLEEYSRMNQRIAENKAIKEQFGIDISNIHDEKMRAQAVGEALKGQSKENLFKKKLEAIEGLGREEEVPEEIPDQEIEQPKKKKKKFLTDKDILKATAIDPALGRALGEQKKAEIKAEETEKTHFQKEREYHTQFTKPVIEKANAALEASTARKGLMKQWKMDVGSGKTEGIGQFLADRSGLNFWLNPESARSKTAAKEYFVAGLGQLASGTRPNQFIEQQLASAMPQVGHTVEAGLTMLEMQDYLDDLNDQKAREVLKLAQEDVEKHGFEKKDINQRAQKNIEKYAEERQNQLAYNIRKIHEDQRNDQQLAEEVVFGDIAPGTPLTQRMANILMLKNNDNVEAAIREAERLGFELPKVKK